MMKMKPKPMHKYGCGLLIFFAFFSPAAVAAEDAPDKRFAVRYLDNEVVVTNKDYFVVRTAFELTSPPNRWVRLDVEFRLSQAVPLVQPNGKMLLKRWNDLFVPDSPRPVRWTDCRLDVDFADLEKAQNLPKDKRFVLWVMGLVWDYASGKHVGANWAVRAPLLVTTNKLRKIVKVESPRLLPLELKRLAGGGPGVDALEANVKTKHLKLIEGVKAYRLYRRPGGPADILASEDVQIWRPGSFGYCFRKIDTPQKAQELACMQHAGGVLIVTREQYDAILRAVRKIGWKAGPDIPAGPDVFGPVVTNVEALGYRVQLLVIEYRDGAPGDIAQWDYYVSHDGRIGGKRTLCIYSGGRADKKGGNLPPRAKKYAHAIRLALTKKGSHSIPQYIKPTGKIVRLSLPDGMQPKDFLPSKDWPQAVRSKPKASKPQPVKPKPVKAIEKKPKPARPEVNKSAPKKPVPIK